MEKTINTFLGAAGSVAEEFMGHMPEQDQKRIGALLAAGNGLSVSAAIQADGSATVLFEAILSDGTRRILAHVCAAQPTVQ